MATSEARERRRGAKRERGPTPTPTLTTPPRRQRSDRGRPEGGFTVPCHRTPGVCFPTRDSHPIVWIHPAGDPRIERAGKAGGTHLPEWSRVPPDLDGPSPPAKGQVVAYGSRGSERILNAVTRKNSSSSIVSALGSRSACTGYPKVGS
jgi:hypothetical protein